MKQTPFTIKHSDLERILDTAQTIEKVYWGKSLIIAYRLENGHIIFGKAACIDPMNFDLAKGQEIAREDAINQLWALEGYLLEQRLYEHRSEEHI